MLNNPYVFYGLIFISALVLIDTLLRALFSRRRANDEVANRLESLKKSSGSEQAYTELLNLRGVRERDGFQEIGNRINQHIAQSGLEISMYRRVLFLLALYLVGFLVAALMLKLGTVARYGFAFGFTIVGCFLILRFVRNRRIKRFTAQLPPAIDIIVRSLKAGHPVVAAIALVAREMPDPIGSEFGILNDQMTFGSDLEQAMLNMYSRVGAPELNLLTVTVSVQRGTGGNLSEILENLGQMIRDRLMIRAKIKAISAEGRITAWIMLMFPVGLFYMILFMVPTYYDLVWESGYGTYFVVGCLSMIFLGMLVIRKLINFDF
ncbi:MAG: type II secretion system F family protein [Rhodobacteraceae bacterium]|nr:type II secretion system F family protein [Paracoccaceae bacterium]